MTTTNDIIKSFQAMPTSDALSVSKYSTSVNAVPSSPAGNTQQMIDNKTAIDFIKEIKSKLDPGLFT
jgi:hypothetical protein